MAASTSLIFAAPSVAAVDCSHSANDALLTISAADSFAGIARSGDALVVEDGFAPVPCSGGPPTVLNTDRVHVSHTGRSGDRIDLTGGPLAPGATPEPTGSSEIELEYAGRSPVDIHGTPGNDQLTFGPGSGINLNGDDDVDVTGSFSMIVAEGRAGDDLIAPQGDYSGIGAQIISAGGLGNDTLIAPPDGGVLHGGDGRDRLIGGPARDNLTGGRGRDLIRGGKGRDIIRAIDGKRDRILCGGGFDKVKVDLIDEFTGCERLIAVSKGRVRAP